MARKQSKTVKAWTIKHGRWVFIDYIRSKKRYAIAAYVNGCDAGWTWKRLYASGARAVTINVSIPTTSSGGE